MRSWAPTKYKTTNWSSYNDSLKQRGSLSIWFDPALAWVPPPSGKRGRQQSFSDAAIQTCLTLKVLFGFHHMKKASGEGTTTFEEAHKTFHMALLANSGSPMLERFCAQLYDLNIRYRYLAVSSTTYQRRDVSAEHDSILEAAVQRDADRASTALLNHYRLTGDYLSRGMDA